MGDRIVALREAAGLKQVDLARAIDIAQPSLHAIEKNQTKALKASTLLGLCSVLRTTADYIIRGDDNQAGLALATMEAELLYIIRTLSADRRVAMIEYARFLLNQQPTHSGAAKAHDRPGNVTHMPRTRRPLR
jgi:transcriptional regulator with XRE-family HTH domain